MLEDILEISYRCFYKKLCREKWICKFSFLVQIRASEASPLLLQFEKLLFKLCKIKFYPRKLVLKASFSASQAPIGNQNQLFLAGFLKTFPQKYSIFLSFELISSEFRGGFRERGSKSLSGIRSPADPKAPSPFGFF